MAWALNKTVLIVDDEDKIRSVTERILEHLGCLVLGASDGSEAVRIFRERSGEIDCVILDVNMPGMDGEETFLELRGIRGDIPVILSSGCSEVEIALRFQDKAVTGFIEKPCRIETLAAKIQAILDKPDRLSTEKA